MPFIDEYLNCPQPMTTQIIRNTGVLQNIVVTMTDNNALVVTYQIFGSSMESPQNAQLDFQYTNYTTSVDIDLGTGAQTPSTTPQPFMIQTQFQPRITYTVTSKNNCRYYLNITHPNLISNTKYRVFLTHGTSSTSVASSTIFIAECTTTGQILIDFTDKTKGKFSSQILNILFINFSPESG